MYFDRDNILKRFRRVPLGRVLWDAVAYAWRGQVGNRLLAPARSLEDAKRETIAATQGHRANMPGRQSPWRRHGRKTHPKYWDRLTGQRRRPKT